MTERRLISLREGFAPNRSALHLGTDQMDAVRTMNNQIRSAEIPFEQVQCICGSSDFREIAGTDRYGLLQPTVICTRCGLVQSNPRMTDAGYTTFYESDLYRRVYDGDGFLEKYETIYSDGRAEELFSRVTARRPVASIQSLLEFGAGGGWNLLPFIRSGIRVAGYELSTDLVELGNGKGIDLRHGGIEDVEGTYDVILLIHVLEHLTDVPGSLAKLGSHLNPGGMLFVEVPDIEDFFMAQIQNAHTYYFSRKTLEFSASRAGLAMTHQARMEAQISAAFATSASAPLPVEFLAGHYDEMVSMLRQFQRNHRVRTPVRALGRVLDLVGLKEPVRNILKPLSSG